MQGQKTEEWWFLSKCAMCNSKKSKSIKQQEASALLSMLGIKIPLIKVTLVGPLLFWM